MTKNSPEKKVSVIIPSLNGDNDNLERLTETVLNAGFNTNDIEVIGAVGVRPNGRARDVGTVFSSGKFLIFMDDDVSFENPEDLKELINFLEKNSHVGLVGPAQQLPPDLPNTVREKAQQLPRSHVESPDEFRECDMVTHACMALRRKDFLKVGMEHPNLISGTDPDLRNRIRSLGKKVGIAPDTSVYHPPISNWKNLMRKNFRGGRRSLFVKRTYPKYHLPAEPDISSTDDTRTEDRLITKVFNHLSRLKNGILKGKFWWLTAQLSYLSGYVYEWFLPESKVDPMFYPDPPSPDHPEWNRFIETLRSKGTIKRLHP